MKSLAKKVQHFLVSEDGPTAVEYAVMLALIVIVCLTAIQRDRHQGQHHVPERVATSLASRSIAGRLRSAKTGRNPTTDVSVGRFGCGPEEGPSGSEHWPEGESR